MCGTHPHIGLATVTYLFDGAQMHRDTLGSVQEVRPGDVNWMTAGRGIAHSERTGAQVRADGHRLHGIQSWVGLPQADEEAPPEFQHFASADLPTRSERNVTLKLITGEAFGLKSPVRTFSPIFYADAQFEPAGSLHVGPEHEERAFFVIEGEIQTGADIHQPGAMLYLEPGEEVTLYSDGPARVMLLRAARRWMDRAISVWNFCFVQP